MKKYLKILLPLVLILLVIIVIILNKGNKKIIKIVDESKEIDGFMCASALEQFYEDDKYIYYYSCMKNNYVKVLYSDGSKETVKDSLKNKKIKIKDLDNYNIDYIKNKK